MTLEHRSYSHAVSPRGPGFVVSRLLLLWLVGYIGMLIVQALVLTATLQPPSALKANQLSSMQILQNVVIEGIRSTLSPWWKSAPWPDGLVMARIQSRLPHVDPLMLHALISSITFAALGFMAGRFLMVHAALLLPALLFIATYGFMNSDLLRVDPLEATSVASVVAVQFACVYGAALWGKWSARS